MGKRRGHITLKELLAAALGQLGGIPHEHRKSMSADQIISLFHRDHDPIPVHIGGPDLHWNIQWIFRGDHIFKTATHDVPMLRKGDRLSEEHESFRRRLLAKVGQADPVAKPRSRLSGRKMQSRPFAKRSKR